MNEIQIIDLHHEGLAQKIAVFLVHGPSGPVLVETGPSSTLETVHRGLRDHGIEPHQIRDVLVTHIHFDHSGAAGWWAQQGATVHVHPKGAPHLIDPSRLVASATRIWGDRMSELWGEVLAVPEERLRVAHDGETIAAGGLEFEVIETPGHADHHHAFRLDSTVFAGDVAGIAIPGTRLLELPTPPPEFRLEAWRESISRLASLNSDRLILTHFGVISEVEEHLRDLAELLEQAAQLVRETIDCSPEEIGAAYGQWNDQRLRSRGLDEQTIAFCRKVNPPDFNVGGLARYWKKRMSRETENGKRNR